MLQLIPPRHRRIFGAEDAEKILMLKEIAVLGSIWYLSER
jgi:hypothetical protein